ncbi:MAG: threonine ammonia-lyase [Candidatus Eremiobacteraeota bacterium]|nr:threonine ammonia-lyase [Candidatus Eremiobacteraeota bacterium]
MPVVFDDVVEAAARIRDYVVATPSLPATALTARLGVDCRLKLETRQRTGSFKDRGAANRMLRLSESERRAGVIAMSAGNHAQAVAYQGKRLGVPATIVMPENTPFTKVRRTEGFGAKVVLAGQNLTEAGERAQILARESGATIVHPYDNADVIAGQGTAGLEFLQTFDDLDVLLVPVGGGGLISGVAIAAKGLRPSIRIVGVQTTEYPSLQRMLDGEPAVQGGQTIAEGIAVKTIGERNFAIARELVDDVLVVGEAAIEEAIHVLLEDEKVLTEGAGAAPVAALMEHHAEFSGKKVGIVISGANIDTGLLANVINRIRLREGRVVRMRVEIAARPGVLADVAQIIGECGANILEVEHQRLLADVPSKNAGLDITFETRSPDDLGRIRERLHDAKYATSVLESSAR